MTAEDAVEDWDLEGLVAQMTALYGSDITVEELREEVDLSRESLTRSSPRTRSTPTTTARTGFGPELMREIERFVILQVVDTRWREHLESMDYLREGVHLRAMAQKDPLVEYRGEGHIMFEELSKIIREEVVATLFHVEVQQDEAEQALAAGRGARRCSPTSTRPRPAPTRSPPPVGSPRSPRMEPVQHQVVKDEERDIGRNDPCWCGSGKKFKRCHGA